MRADRSWMPWWLWLIDSLWVLLVCRAFGRHMWIWREHVRIPCYGWGAWWCADCGLIKVKP